MKLPFNVDSAIGVQRTFATDGDFTTYTGATPKEGDIYFNDSTSPGKYRYFSNGGWQDLSQAGSGDVSGPGSSTTNAIAVWGDASGQNLIDSALLLTGTTIRPPDDMVADANPAASMTISGANKVAGTGDGGITSIGSGSSAGGRGGDIILQPASGTVPGAVYASGRLRVSTAFTAIDAVLPSNVMYYGVTDVSALRTITLPAISDVQDGTMVVVKDETGGASINTIEIDASGGDSIDGVATMVIDDDFGSAFLVARGTSWHVITAGGGGGGSGVTAIGTYDSQTPAANGLTIVGSSLFAQSASTTVPGMMSLGAQSFLGVKSFYGATFNSNNFVTINPTTNWPAARFGNSVNSYSGIDILNSNAGTGAFGILSFTNDTMTTVLQLEARSSTYTGEPGQSNVVANAKLALKATDVLFQSGGALRGEIVQAGQIKLYGTSPNVATDLVTVDAGSMNPIDVLRNVNGNSQIHVRNTSAGAGAAAGFRASNDVLLNAIQVTALGSNAGNKMRVESSLAGGMEIMATNTTAPINFLNGAGAAVRATFPGNTGDFRVYGNSSNIATDLLVLDPGSSIPFLLNKNVNGTIQLQLNNANAGSSAFTQFVLGNDLSTNYAGLVLTSSGASFGPLNGGAMAVLSAGRIALWSQAENAIVRTGSINSITALNTGGVVMFGSGLRMNRVTSGDADATITVGTTLHGAGATTANRTLTLPTAAAAGAGFYLEVKDEGGTAGTFPLTIQRGTGGDTIEGNVSVQITVDRGILRLYSDGVNTWYTR